MYGLNAFKGIEISIKLKNRLISSFYFIVFYMNFKLNEIRSLKVETSIDTPTRAAKSACRMIFISDFENKFPRYFFPFVFHTFRSSLGK